MDQQRSPLYYLVTTLFIAAIAVVGLCANLSTGLAAPLPEDHLTFITVTTAIDELNSDGDCSLREAIQAANTDSAVDACPAGDGDDLIYLLRGAYTLTLSGANEDRGLSGDLDITSTLSIYGDDMAATIIDGYGLDRVLHIHAGAVVSMTQLTFTNGHAPDGANGQEKGEPGDDGGAILNQGTLALAHVTVESSHAGKGGGTLGDYGVEPPVEDGGRGGGIFNAGRLHMANTVVTQNTGGDGGGDDGGECNYPPPGGGDGGGIFNSGDLLIRESQILGNRSGWSTDGFCYRLYYTLHRGDGGGLYNLAEATLISVTLDGNRVGSSPDGSLGGAIYSDGRLTMTHSHVNGNRAREGGGIYSTGWLTLRESVVTDNVVSGSNVLFSSNDGGGLYLEGMALIADSTIHKNATGRGGDGDYLTGYGHSSGSGGGIFSGASLILRNSTVSGNRTGDGGNAIWTIYQPGPHGGGSAGSGGGIASFGELLIENSTITANRAGVGGKGNDDESGPGLPGRDGVGGGLSIGQQQTTMRNTILVGNSATTYADCAGVLSSSSHNWIGPGQGCAVSGEENGNVLIPLMALSALGMHGGPTPTHMPMSGSPAVDAGHCNDSHGAPVLVDQRGEPRPQGTACDIGAVESPHDQTVTRLWLPTMLVAESGAAGD